ncbi:hypothetical protein CJD44_36495, partial [Streptomyces sp. alain-838]
MRVVPRWVLFSSGCAPVLLIGGWSGAALFEGPAYDPATQTISVLGAHGASGYWVMTVAFLALGACHLLTAWGVAGGRDRRTRGAGRRRCRGAGRDAASPRRAAGGSLRHGAVAVVGYTLLAVWPVLASTSERAAP